MPALDGERKPTVLGPVSKSTRRVFSSDPSSGHFICGEQRATKSTRRVLSSVPPRRALLVSSPNTGIPVISRKPRRTQFGQGRVPAGHISAPTCLSRAGGNPLFISPYQLVTPLVLRSKSPAPSPRSRSGRSATSLIPGRVPLGQSSCLAPSQCRAAVALRHWLRPVHRPNNLKISYLNLR